MSKNDSILRSVVGTINSKIPLCLVNVQSCHGLSIDELKIRIQEFEQFSIEILELLNSHSVVDHQLLWLHSLHEISQLLSKLQRLSKEYLSTPHGSFINRKLSESKSKLLNSCVFFFEQDQKLISKFTKTYQELLSNVLYILQFEELENAESYNISIFPTIKDVLQNHQLEFFDTIVHFNKVVYYVDQSSHFILLPPTYPAYLISKELINLPELINFYRFTSFNLISIGDFKQAQIYLKILIDNPCLKLSSYNEENLLIDSDRESKIVTLLERQEISLLFMLNYLLSSSSYLEIVNYSKDYRNELQFLNRSLSNSLSKEIEAASQPGSRHSSVISFQSLTTTANYKTYDYLSSIIYTGTYKIKLHNIIEITDILLNFNKPLFDEKCRSIQNCDKYSNFLFQARVGISHLMELSYE